MFCFHFSIFFHPIQLYSPYTLQNHFIFILTSLFYSIHLSLHVYLQKHFLNYFQTTLIWVITHTQPKHQDLLGFVLNPNSITYNLNHESIQNYKIPSISIPFLLFLIFFFFFSSSSSSSSSSSLFSSSFFKPVWLSCLGDKMSYFCLPPPFNNLTLFYLPFGPPSFY